tara:strand:- start:542 stop:850 length:309 start_codon:yes stop_codon:yes gene_type:complete
MRSATILVVAILLSGCSTSASICQQWRNKELSDEKAAEILGISPVKDVVPADKGPEIVHTDGTREKGKMIVTYQAGFIAEVSCTAIEEGMVDSIPVWTLGRR